LLYCQGGRLPRTSVYFYREENGETPVLEWLRGLRRSDARAYAKCVAAVHELAALGHELRRPLADYLRDGLYELRMRVRRQNYRMLYFFHGQGVAILAHGLTKEDRVPVRDIERALRKKKLFQANPERHTHQEELSDA